MTASKAESLINSLTNKKRELETNIAVKKSELSNLEKKLDETSSKVQEIVGSTEVGPIKEYLNELEKTIAIDIDKLKEIGE